MTEEPSALAVEADAVLEECVGLMEEAVAVVASLEQERADVLRIRDAARARADRAHEEMALARNVGADRRRKEAGRELSAAEREASSADRYLASGDLDPEYRKAVARQIAALARDDARTKLTRIADRSDDPRLRETVTACEEDSERAARYVLNRFPPAREMEPGEVRKARAEAAEIIESLSDPPAGRATSASGEGAGIP